MMMRSETEEFLGYNSALSKFSMLAKAEEQLFGGFRHFLIFFQIL